MRDSLTSSGWIPSRSALAVSIAVAQKSPIFCWSLPGAAEVAADCSLLLRRLRYSCSRTALAIPHAESVLGIGLRFNQPPFAYVKKSCPGLTDGSMLAWRKSVRRGGSIEMTEGLQAVKSTAAPTESVFRFIVI